MYSSEKEFLDSYNKFDYDLISLTTDILLFSVSSEMSSNYRKNDEKKMSILLVKRDNYPFKDKWCLPGGFLKIDEDIEDAPKRILKEETNLDHIYLEQLYTFGEVNRDPRMRVVSTAYMALVDKNRLESDLLNNACWFDIVVYNESDNIVDIVLDNGIESINIKIKKTLKEETTDRYSFDILDSNALAFDHAKVILSGLERLKNKCQYTDIVFNMMPEYFTLGELQQVYEVILNKKLLDPAFRRIIEPKVVKTDKVKTGEGHRPSKLFKYKNKN
jgi:ADP-ribose pyrophosphatase YjhB (NUDIX family)